MSASPTDTLDRYRTRLEEALDARLPGGNLYPARLHEAMRYGSEGGKRLRALLVYAAGEALQLSADVLDAPACAVELIHAYSLVHDDLPAMDDDALRRGRPTVHVAYDEPTGILVGDALLTLAFGVLAEPATGVTAEQQIGMVRVLAEAAGSRGMVGGQAVDIESEGKRISLPELEALHIHKTGALILSCLRLAACARPDLDDTARNALDHYGKTIGLAFQIQDDVLDVESSTEALGKTQGKDAAQEKSTYVALMGLAGAKQRAIELFDQARAALRPFGDNAGLLRALADHIQQRDH